MLCDLYLIAYEFYDTHGRGEGIWSSKYKIFITYYQYNNTIQYGIYAEFPKEHSFEDDCIDPFLGSYGFSRTSCKVPSLKNSYYDNKKILELPKIPV